MVLIGLVTTRANFHTTAYDLLQQEPCASIVFLSIQAVRVQFYLFTQSLTEIFFFFLYISILSDVLCSVDETVEV